MTEQTVEPQKKNAANAVSRFFRSIARIFRFLRVSVANFLVLILLFGVIVFLLLPDEEIDVEDGSILIFRPSAAIVEEFSSQDFMDLLTNVGPLSETRLRDVVTNLRKAAKDPRIIGLEIRPERLISSNLVQLETLGNAINTFKESGKPVISYSNSYTQSQYFLASHADSVHMHPLGTVFFTGFAYRSNFYKELFEKLKVTIHTFKVGDYKSAVEPYTQTGFSEEAKLAYQPVVDQLWNAYTSRIAINRALKREFLKNFVTTFPTLVEESQLEMSELIQEAGLLDGLTTKHDFQTQVRKQYSSSEQPPVISLENYGVATARDDSSVAKDKIGIVTIRGTIIGETIDLLPALAPGSLGRLRTARKDESVRAVIVRVDSPGGTVFGSEELREEISLIQEKGIPVVVSMAGTAASGGYWLSAGADMIFASSSTITGSIGVFSMFPSFEQTLDAVGVASDAVHSVPNAVRMDPLTGLHEGEQKILQASVESMYKRFLQVVGQGRGLSSDVVDEIAQGRIWTGSQALEIGLIDAIGDLDKAIEKAAELANLEHYQIKEFRPERTRLQELLFSPLTELEFAHELKEWTRQLNEAVSDFQLPLTRGETYAFCRSCTVDIGL